MDIGKNGQYFVICALVLDDFQGKNFASMVKFLIKEHSKFKKTKEIHASQMSFAHKEYFFKHLHNVDFKIHYLVIDKNNIKPELFRDKDICFNYMIQLIMYPLFKNIDVLNIYVTIDERNIKTTSQKSLEDYLRVELLKHSLFNKQIYVRYEDSRKYKNLQAVDMFANAIYRKYNYHKDDLYNYFSSKIVKSVIFPTYIDTKNKKE
jgi:Protein of unknown function (DUF3800)